MFSDTMSDCLGFCHAPSISLTDPTRTTRAISGTECSVHWALFGESGFLSTSVPHLETTVGHQEVPRWLQQFTQRHSGKSGIPRQVGLFP